MHQRVLRLLSPCPALFEVKTGVEIRVRVASLAPALLKVMNQRVDVALGDVRVSRQIVFGVEQPGFSYLLVVAEQRFHQASWVVARMRGNENRFLTLAPWPIQESQSAFQFVAALRAMRPS